MNQVQQRTGAPVTHTDDWLITYADMITLLLCFFVVFFVVLSSRKNGQEEPYAARVLVPMMRDIHPAPQDSLAHAIQPNMRVSAFNNFDNSSNSLADEVAARIGRPVPARPISTSGAIPAVAPAEPSSRSKIGADANPNPNTDIAPKGDRISMLEVSSSMFFGSGSAELSESGKSILRDVTVELKSKQYEQYHIVVEGHTDDTPIGTARFSSNWELSTARAAAVVHFFLDQGLPAQKLQAAGYADTRPKLPNRDAEGNPIPENQSRNRRVVIRLEKIERSE